MVSSVTDAQKFLSNHWMRIYDFDPGDTNADLISVYNTAATPVDGWLDMSEFSNVVGVYKSQVGTAAVNMSLVVATSSTQTVGATTYTAVKSVALTQVTIINNYFLEFDVSEVQSLTTTTGVQYCNLEISSATGTDEGVAALILCGKRGYLDQTGANLFSAGATTGTP